MNRVELQPAFVLHTRPYRETSLLIDCFSRDFGRLTLVAKGARKGKNPKARVLQPFQLLDVSFNGKADLKNLMDVELSRPTQPLKGSKLYCGYYLNELLMRLLPELDPHHDIFEDYSHSITALHSEVEIESVLRWFEWQLLCHLGYGFSLSEDVLGNPIVEQYTYEFLPEQGFIFSQSSSNTYSGEVLLELSSGNSFRHDLSAFQKRLMRDALRPYLGKQPLRSRQLYLDLYGSKS